MSDMEDPVLIETIARELRAPERLPATFERRLEAAVHALADRNEIPDLPEVREAARITSLRGWLVERRTVRTSRLQVLAAAAMFAATVATTTLMLHGDTSVSTPDVAAAGASAPPQLVQFAIAAPGAASVSLVGDFNGWDSDAIPMTSGTVEGLWIVSVPLAAGTYQYAFVIDDSTWRADPAARLSITDEFGAPSSLITLSERTT